MSMRADDLRDWLDTLDKNAEVGVDEGGLTLRVVGEEGEGQSYCEVGGLPEGDDR